MVVVVIVVNIPPFHFRACNSEPHSTAGAQGWRNDSRGGGGGTRPGAPRKRVSKCLKGPKTTYTSISIAEKTVQEKQKGSIFVIYLSPRAPPRKLN